MLLARPLDDVLSSQAKVRVLRVLAQSPVALTGREIARRAGTATGHISRVLRELSAAEIIGEAGGGRAKLYTYQDDTALARQLKELFVQEGRRLRGVVRALAKSTFGLQAIILFGSEARGEAAAHSDTDLLLVVQRLTRSTEAEARRQCLSLAEAEHLHLSWHVVDMARLYRWHEASDPFWVNVVQDGLLLWGTDPGALIHGHMEGLLAPGDAVLGGGRERP
ncbi:DUF294 nucleotidyltransferase-like domain-containing protein [bacterium]|nr:DUF294 nucleotidyltransferase-like domain-containing protein [bacterium]